MMVSPKFLHSNSISHVWVFGAIAQLIDNAYDPDVNAKSLVIDKEEIGGETCLVFQDNGAGMDHSHLHKMLSFGFCEKDELIKKSHLPVGHYGNGFKSGSMRIGKDVLVFTKYKDSASVGLLSQTFLKNTKAKSVLVPSLEYRIVDQIEIIKQFEKIKDKTGTRIIIYNLCKLSDGKLELDFDRDPKDILYREVHIDGVDFTEVMHTNKKLKYRQSLREYCRILYYWPKMKIMLRGSTVKTKMIAKSLSKTEVDVYRPKWLKKRIIPITIGFRCEDHDSEDYGMMLYHNNRLIKAYEKVGNQKQANEKGFGVIGVAQVDFLQPTQNKQDFVVDAKYNTVMKAFGEKLNDYWNEKEQLIQENLQSFQPDSLWANCDSCGKWRRLPMGTDKDSLPNEWFCYMNPDKKHSHCEDTEEKEKDDEYARPSYQKNMKRKLKEQKSIEKQSRQSTQSKISQEEEEGSQLTSKKNLTQPPSPLFSNSPSKNSPTRKRPASISSHKEDDSPSKSSPSKRITRQSASDMGMKSLDFFFKKNDDNVKKIMPADSTLECCEANADVNNMQEASTSANTLDSMLHVTDLGNKDISNSSPTLTGSHVEMRKSQHSLLLPILDRTSTESVSPGTHQKMASFKNHTLSALSDSQFSQACDSDHSPKKIDNISDEIIDVDNVPESSKAHIKDNEKTEDRVEIFKEYQLKLRNIENGIIPPLVVAGNHCEKETKFQKNVHYLLKLLVPKLVTVDVTSTEQLVEDLIGLIESTELEF